MAVRRAFGLPAYGAELGLPAPPVCGACGVGAHREGERIPAKHPRKQVDLYGEHALSCNRTAVTTRRHNAIARTLVQIADRAGCLPFAQNKALMDGGYKRPGDVTFGRWPGRESGLAVDVTVRSTWVMSAAEAELDKREYYAKYFSDYTTQGFAPFAIDLHGGIGPETWNLIKRLAAMTAMIPWNFVNQSDALRDIVTDLSWTFVTEITRQVSQSGDRRVARSFG